MSTTSPTSQKTITAAAQPGAEKMDPQATGPQTAIPTIYTVKLSGRHARIAEYPDKHVRFIIQQSDGAWPNDWDLMCNDRKHISVKQALERAKAQAGVKQALERTKAQDRQSTTGQPAVTAQTGQPLQATEGPMQGKKPAAGASKQLAEADPKAATILAPPNASADRAKPAAQTRAQQPGTRAVQPTTIAKPATPQTNAVVLQQPIVPVPVQQDPLPKLVKAQPDGELSFAIPSPKQLTRNASPQPGQQPTAAAVAPAPASTGSVFDLSVVPSGGIFDFQPKPDGQQKIEEGDQKATPVVDLGVGGQNPNGQNPNPWAVGPAPNPPVQPVIPAPVIPDLGKRRKPDDQKAAGSTGDGNGSANKPKKPSTKWHWIAHAGGTVALVAALLSKNCSGDQNLANNLVNLMRPPCPACECNPTLNCDDGNGKSGEDPSISLQTPNNDNADAGVPEQPTQPTIKDGPGSFRADYNEPTPQKPGLVLQRDGNGNILGYLMYSGQLVPGTQKIIGRVEADVASKTCKQPIPRDFEAAPECLSYLPPCGPLTKGSIIPNNCRMGQFESTKW